MAILALSLLGCTQTFRLNAPPADPTRPSSTAAAGPARVVTGKRVWAHHFLLGFVGRKSTDTRDYCENGVVTEVRLKHSVSTILLWPVTAFIYTPRWLQITCAPQGGEP